MLLSETPTFRHNNFIRRFVYSDPLLQCPYFIRAHLLIKEYFARKSLIRAERLNSGNILYIYIYPYLYDIWNIYILCLLSLLWFLLLFLPPFDRRHFFFMLDWCSLPSPFFSLRNFFIFFFFRSSIKYKLISFFLSQRSAVYPFLIWCASQHILLLCAIPHTYSRVWPGAL